MKLYTSLSLVIGFCLIITSATSSSKMVPKFIIDTDGGADDAAAILLALGAQKHLKNSAFEVIAITCTYGNTNIHNVKTNVLKMLTIANRNDIPVYVGSHNPIIKNYKQDHYFGEDGFGDFVFDEKILGQINTSKHASLALVDLAAEHAGNVNIMAIGPLTNVALAISLDSKFLQNVVRFYIMGSSVRGTGNIAPNVEFNFYQDPHSNFIVIDGTKGQPVLLFPWETTLSAGIKVEWRKKVLGIVDSRPMRYLNKIEGKSLRGPNWEVADVMFTALILSPELITRTLVTNLTPVFDGAADGTVLVDYTNRTGKPRNVEIIQNFDVEGFKNLLLKVLSKD